jgi:hypothetical protein
MPARSKWRDRPTWRESQLLRGLGGGAEQEGTKATFFTVRVTAPNVSCTCTFKMDLKLMPQSDPFQVTVRLTLWS